MCQQADLTDAAQTTKNYAAYTQKIAACASAELRNLGIALYVKVGAANGITANAGDWGGNGFTLR
ncbi:DUF2000 family protein [Brevibacillus marinus]|uniref:DUF2000 family protein n=1 Tax=Brevibacillus marinus TaxID=2496837 RepID=UPI000F817CE0|nr:DUF2000 family protein [Brevibacillus marinus]